jgi:hypothetical protein
MLKFLLAELNECSLKAYSLDEKLPFLGAAIEYATGTASAPSIL